MANRFLSFFLFCFFFFTGGCKKDHESGNSQPSALISVYALLPDAPKINVFINGANTATSLPYGSYTLYNPSTPGSTNIHIQTASQKVLLDTSITTTASTYYSLFLTDTLSHVTPVFIKDAIGTASDTLFLRFFNFSPDAPAVDIYGYSDNTNHKTIWRNRSISNDANSDSINQFIGTKLGSYHFYAVRSGSKDTLARFLNTDLSTAGYYTLFLKNKFRVPGDSLGTYDTTLQLGVRLHG